MDALKTSTREKLRTSLLTTPAGRTAMILPRAASALRATRLLPKCKELAVWAVRSKEIGDFTYETTQLSDQLLCQTLAQVTGESVEKLDHFLGELRNDDELAQYYARIAASPEYRWNADPRFLPGRRIAFYLLTRAMKPRRIVEAGLNKGLGAILISRALKRNAAEGSPGGYIGIEYDHRKTIGFYEKYPDKTGTLVRGDSLTYLEKPQAEIDLFIHDTMAEDPHLSRQIELAGRLMAPGGVVVSSWATQPLANYAAERRLSLLTHQDIVRHHWYDGSRIAFVFGFKGH